MKKTLKRLMKYGIAAMLLLPGIGMPAFADSVESITWMTDVGAVILSDTPDDSLPAIIPSLPNSIEVSFAGETVEYASLIMVPVNDGLPEEATPENIVLVSQQPVEKGIAAFHFYLKPSIANGVYAVHAGGSNTEYVTRYFEVKDNIEPELTKEQILQYDDYKNSIVLSFDIVDKTEFEAWTAQKEKMEVTLSSGDKFVKIKSDDIKFDTAAGTIAIHTSGYAEIFPAFGSPIEGNIQKTNISIATPGYWGDTEVGGGRTGVFGLVIPEVSAEGFSRGMNFDITIYSEKALNGACPIITLYDDNILVGCVIGDEVRLAAGETKEVSIELKCANLIPSGNFSIRVMLWQGSELKPLTSFVSFP